MIRKLTVSTLIGAIVRTGNSTQELDTREALAHIAERKRSR